MEAIGVFAECLKLVLPLGSAIMQTGRMTERMGNQMARGWESKGVEAQIEGGNGAKQQKPVPLSAAAIQLNQKKQGLLLSRTRVQRDLETARNERYRSILQQALAQLDKELAALDNHA